MSAKSISWGDIIRRNKDKSPSKKPYNVSNISPIDDEIDEEVYSSSNDDNIYESLEGKYLNSVPAGTLSSSPIYNAYSSSEAAPGQSIVCQII